MSDKLIIREGSCTFEVQLALDGKIVDFDIITKGYKNIDNVPVTCSLFNINSKLIKENE